jgi:hypothetical protein
LLVLFYFSHIISAQEKPLFKKPLYPQNGKDWVGRCQAGKFQSPINIIDGINTVEDTSVASFDYSIPEDGLHKKLIFTGDQVYMDINLGKMAFINGRGANEIYEAYRIELHFPSEHYVTMNGQTPRYPLELQIYHNIVMSDNTKNTNQTIKVNRAVVSFFFSIGDLKEGDVFLNQLGISNHNVDAANIPYKFNINEHIQQKKISSLLRMIQDLM